MDKDPIAGSLGMQGKKCCDGLIFYAQDKDEKRTICLVEMKSSNLKEAAEQITETRRHLEAILQQELQLCNDFLKKISWKACFYSNHCSQEKTDDCKRTLLSAGFKREDIIHLFGRNNDIGTDLRKSEWY